MLRKLFRERYGKDFALVDVELYPGNHVNPQVVLFRISIILFMAKFWSLERSRTSLPFRHCVEIFDIINYLSILLIRFNLNS